MLADIQYNDIASQFLLETLVFNAADGLLEIAVALAISVMLDLPVSILLCSVGLVSLFSGVGGVMFGLYPAQKVAVLRPGDALRHE